MVFLKTFSIVLILCRTIKKNMQLETSRKNVQSYIDKQMKFLLLSLYMPKTYQWKTKFIPHFFCTATSRYKFNKLIQSNTRKI